MYGIFLLQYIENEKRTGPMTKEREGELLMLGLTLLESWFPILSIVAMSYVGALHTYMYSLMIALFFYVAIMYKRKRFSELKTKKLTKTYFLLLFGLPLFSPLYS